MTQNIIALFIVFLAAVISIVSIIRSITSKNGGHCDGCSACGTSGQDKPTIKKLNQYRNIKFQDLVIDNKKSK